MHYREEVVLLGGEEEITIENSKKICGFINYSICFSYTGESQDLQKVVAIYNFLPLL